MVVVTETAVPMVADTDTVVDGVQQPMAQAGVMAMAMAVVLGEVIGRAPATMVAILLLTMPHLWSLTFRRLNPWS
jgi:hypothetical protein